MRRPVQLVLVALIWGYLVPVFAVVFGVAIRDEPLSWHEPAGGALIIAGVALAQRRPARRPSTL